MEQVLAQNVLHEIQKVTDRMLLVPLVTSLVPQPQPTGHPDTCQLGTRPLGTGSITSSKLFVGRFISRIKRSQVMSLGKFGPKALNFDLNFFQLVT